MGALSKRDEARVADLDHLLADLNRACDDADVVAQLADVIGVDATTNLRFDYENDRLLVAEARTAGRHFISRRDLERLKCGVRAGEMQFLFSSPVPERAQRNRIAEVPSVRSAPKTHGREATKLGLTNEAMNVIRPRLAALLALYEEMGITEMHNARILVCEGPLLLRYVSILDNRPFTRRQRALFVRCTQALHRRTVLDHRLGVESNYHAAFAVAMEALGSAAFLVDHRGGVMHANQLGIAALDHDHDLAAQLFTAVRGEPGPFDVHPVSDRGSPSRFVVVRKHSDLGQVAVAFAMEHGFGGRGRDVFVAAATGESTKHIAARLGIAENTVEYHLTKVFRTVGVTSRSELQRVLTERLLAQKTFS